MTAASAEINLQSKHDLICHVARLKKKKTRVNHEPRSAHGRAVNKKIF